MNLSIDLAKDALQNPSAELSKILNDPKVPQEAKEAMQAEGFKGESKQNAQGEGRLQVVDENQKFR
jgi:hypothetical protein